MRALLIGAILGVLALVAIVVLLPPLKPNTAPVSKRQIDYQLEKFTTVVFDSTGSISHTISGDLLLHFARDDSLQINNPSGEFKRKHANWQISAAHAFLNSDFSVIDWQRQVVVQKDNRATLKTEQLTQRGQTIYSDVKSSISFANGNLVANSLRMDLDAEKLSLKQGVHSVYNP